MKIENFINLITNISEKFNNVKEQQNIELHCEVLHSSLAELFKNFTEESYKSIPLYARLTLEKLENSILEHVSVEYKQNLEDYRKENGKFYKESTKKEVKVTTKVKSKIGYIKEEGAEN